jgi:hypothetical protein
VYIHSHTSVKSECRGWNGAKKLPETDADRNAQVAIVDSFKIKVSRAAKGKKRLGL